MYRVKRIITFPVEKILDQQHLTENRKYFFYYFFELVRLEVIAVMSEHSLLTECNDQGYFLCGSHCGHLEKI